MDCLFCKIANKEIKSKIIYENDSTIAFLDIHPHANGEILIIPKKHYTDFIEVSNDDLISMFEVARLLTPKILPKLKRKGLTLSINYGNRQEMKHVHMHLVPGAPNKNKIKPLDDIYNLLMDSE